MTRFLFAFLMIFAGFASAAVLSGNPFGTPQQAHAETHHANPHKANPHAANPHATNPVSPHGNAPSMAEIAANYFVMMDENRDGKLTEEERARMPNHSNLTPFADLDLDKDGFVEFEEYVTALEANVGKPRSRGVEI